MFAGGRHEVTGPGRRAPQVAAMDAVLLAELIETASSATVCSTPECWTISHIAALPLN